MQQCSAAVHVLTCSSGLSSSLDLGMYLQAFRQCSKFRASDAAADQGMQIRDTTVFHAIRAPRVSQASHRRRFQRPHRTATHRMASTAAATVMLSWTGRFPSEVMKEEAQLPRRAGTMSSSSTDTTTANSTGLTRRACTRT